MWDHLSTPANLMLYFLNKPSIRSVFRFLGDAWECSIHQMAVATVKLEILSIAPNSEVS